MSEERQASVTRKWTFPQPQSAALPFLDASPTFFAPAVVVDPTIYIDVPHLDASPTFYSPTLELTDEKSLTVWDNAINVVAPGQSNMLQRNGGSFSTDPRVKIWNRTNTGLEQWLPGGSPQHDFPDPGVGSSGPQPGDYPLAFHAAKVIAATHDVQVNIICVAWGDTEIEEHLAGSTINNEMLAQLAAAAPWMPRIDLLMWHQGESDGGDADYFTVDLPAYLAQMRGLPQSHANLPFIAGELEEGRTTFNAAFASFVSGDPNSSLASSAGLATSDGTHFIAVDGETLGQRMAALFEDHISTINAAAVGTGPSGNVADLTATTVSDSEIDLAWTDLADASVVGYIIEQDSGAGFVELTRVADGVEAYSVNSLTGSTEYTYRIYAVNAFGKTVSNTDAATTDETPVAVLPTTDLLAYWEADSEVYSDTGTTLAVLDDTVRQWNDLSGNGHTLLQATEGEKPVFKTNIQNGLPALRFDGGQFMERFGTVKSGAPVSIIVVASLDDTGVGGVLAGLTNSGSNQEYLLLAAGASAQFITRDGSTIYSGESPNPPGIVNGSVFDAALICTSTTSRAVYFNGANENTSTQNQNPTITEFSIGANDRSSIERYLTGYIMGAYVYDVAITPSILADVVAYTKYKWSY